MFSLISWAFYKGTVAICVWRSPLSLNVLHDLPLTITHIDGKEGDVHFLPIIQIRISDLRIIEC